MHRGNTPDRRLSAFAYLLITVSALPALAAIGSAQADAESARGFRIVDGDTLVLGSEKIRLEGIDAPELAQTCLNADGRTWACGKQAKRHLQRLTSAGRVTCEGDALDAYDRRIATCYADGINVNAEMIRSGHALAFRRYSTAYVLDEEMARLSGTGLWAGTFERPWDYRAHKWQVAAQTAPGDCAIKGNISANGRIYHTPWSPSYARTRINEAAGERWFCSEDEAIAAGWRAPH